MLDRVRLPGSPGKRAAGALAGCCLALALGCGGKLDPPVDTDQASAALAEALDAWKQGDEYGSLGQRQPPIYFREPEWEAGKKLLAFRAGRVDLLGRQGRCSVSLSLRDRSGKVTERGVRYLIDTTPQVVIVREELGP
jgi:hypothetical protein